MSDNLLDNKYLKHLKKFELHTSQLISNQALLLISQKIQLDNGNITLSDFENSAYELVSDDKSMQVEVETLNYIRNRIILIFKIDNGLE
jgi:hypothetical protein